MSDRMHDDDLLEGFFQAARAVPPEPSPNFLAHLADGVPDPAQSGVARRKTTGVSWLSGWLAGGWIGLGGLVAATVVGVWIGVAGVLPEAVADPNLTSAMQAAADANAETGAQDDTAFDVASADLTGGGHLFANSDILVLAAQ